MGHFSRITADLDEERDTLAAAEEMGPPGFERLRTYAATIRLRRDLGRAVRPDCEAMDGLRVTVQAGWRMDEDDKYPGEWAMLFPSTQRGFPVHWIASGDLTDIEELSQGRACGALRGSHA